MPKVSEGQQNTETQKALPDVVGSKKQVSYRTEIIGGVPIVTPTQVNPPAVLYMHNSTESLGPYLMWNNGDAEPH